jgi:hypothetical protein
MQLAGYERDELAELVDVLKPMSMESLKGNS